MGKQPPTRQQVAAVLGAVAVLLGGGTGAGYALHGSAATAAPAMEAFPMERGTALEQWRAAEVALKERDRQERAEMVQALRDSAATNASLREAVVGLTERMTGFDRRLSAVEVGGVRPASGKRP